MKKLFFVILNLSFAAILFSCEKEDIEEQEKINFLNDTTIQYKKIAGVDENLLSLDIYTIPNSKSIKPVVIWIHGGGWAIGDKSNSMEYKIPFFQDEDYVFVSTNYRLSPIPYEIENENKIQYPDHIIDVADAVSWVYKHIHKYGGDSAKIIVMGHSAGAHLAALLATDQYWLESNGLSIKIIKGVAPLDTEAFNLVTRINRDSSALFLNAFTLDEVAWQEASPFFKIEDGEKLPKNWFFVERGTLKRRAILNEFIGKLENNGVQITKIIANGYSHEDVNKKIGEPGEKIVTPAIKSFLQKSF
jgi:predicted esterase